MNAASSTPSLGGKVIVSITAMTRASRAVASRVGGDEEVEQLPSGVAVARRHLLVEVGADETGELALRQPCARDTSDDRTGREPCFLEAFGQRQEVDALGGLEL